MNKFNTYSFIPMLVLTLMFTGLGTVTLCAYVLYKEHIDFIIFLLSMFGMGITLQRVIITFLNLVSSVKSLEKNKL